MIQDELDRLEQELETNNLLDTFMKEKIEQQIAQIKMKSKISETVGLENDISL
jgi:hypothetical protein